MNIYQKKNANFRYFYEFHQNSNFKRLETTGTVGNCSDLIRVTKPTHIQ